MILPKDWTVYLNLYWIWLYNGGVGGGGPQILLHLSFIFRILLNLSPYDLSYCALSVVTSKGEFTQLMQSLPKFGQDCPRHKHWSKGN